MPIEGHLRTTSFVHLHEEQSGGSFSKLDDGSNVRKERELKLISGCIVLVTGNSGSEELLSIAKDVQR